MEKGRDYTLDVIRIVATFAVISVHFFKNNEFYNIPIVGERMYIMVLLRNFFIICVPLFLILTGYLMGRKKPNKGYYKGITKTLIIYVLASSTCIIYKQISGIVRYDLKHALFAILDFSGANYSWYIEMYIGLFLYNSIFEYNIFKYRSSKKEDFNNYLFITYIDTNLYKYL